MIRRSLFLCLLALPASGWAATPEREFAEEMVERLSDNTPAEAEFRIGEDDPLEVQIKNAGEWEEGQLNLHRLYNFCQNASAEDCETEKATFATNIFKTQPDPVRERLRVIVRDQDYVDYIEQMPWPDGGQPILREIGEGLFALLALDFPETIRVASGKDLEEFGLDETAAWELAMQQTKAILPELPREQIGAGQATAFQDAEYLASLLAFTEDWAEISRNAPPDMFVTAASDNFVFVAFMPTGPKLDDFKQVVAEDCNTQPRCVSPFIYRFRNGRWVIAD